MSLHCQRCTILLVAARKNALEDVSAPSLVLHTQNFPSATEKYDAPKFTIDSVGHCIRYANIKVFSKPNFPI